MGGGEEPERSRAAGGVPRAAAGHVRPQAPAKAPEGAAPTLPPRGRAPRSLTAPSGPQTLLAGAGLNKGGEFNGPPPPHPAPRRQRLRCFCDGKKVYLAGLNSSQMRSNSARKRRTYSSSSRISTFSLLF